MKPNMCEVCFSTLGEDDMEDGVTIPAECCERIGLCRHCRELGEHDCDDSDSDDSDSDESVGDG